MTNQMPNQNLDLLVTDHYLISASKVGDMYQKYIDDKVLPQRPENAYNLVLSTNRFAEFEMVTANIIYKDNRTVETMLQQGKEQIKHLTLEHVIESPYELYKFMENFTSNRDKYISACCSWIVTAPEPKPMFKDLYIGKN